MKKFLTKIDLPFKNYILVSIGVNVLIIIAVLVLRKDVLPPEVPLFYGLPEGQEQLTNSFALIFPSIVSIFITVLNSIIASFIHDGFLKKSLIVSGIFSVFFPLATILKIIFLVGSF